MNDFNSVKKVFFLGIGGIGVSAVARMFLSEGKWVGGSDTAESEITDELKEASAAVFIGQDINDLPADTDLVIYSIAIEKFAPDFLKLVRERVPQVISYPQALSIISKDKFTIAVSGSHGKTTTTAMIAKVLMDADLSPTVIVGSKLLDVKSNFVAGTSKYFVVEACEYCRSFLEINPTIVCVTNIDADHLDYYKDLDDVKKAFKEFIAKVPAEGRVIGNLADKDVVEVFSESEVAKIDSSQFSFTEELTVPGEHNRQNASIAFAVADFLNIPKTAALKSLIEFKGTWRRFEYKGETKKGALVYDDYAHHPTEIEATLAAARQKFPNKKIIIVFQPHLFSRTKALLPEFTEALKKADEAVMLPIYPAREVFDPTISSDMLVEQIGEKASLAQSFDETKGALSRFGNDSIILVMGAGSISELPSLLIND